ncbi:HAD family hydrolase [Paenibacillus planticolens]|uniref:HAD hydrolase-like protein n=1 Tax=Paenibacillus planticolens TaxID=2654976 RepID=A0ABX1ZSH7_9BACL|nr:HAD hydrolase-like protein [Paenibacillus planticolens]NOV02000.1 HAD hydrolase-like protein [Paenibacillus planticolens]
MSKYTKSRYSGVEVLKNEESAVKGIIFDMDNTLLQSHIDFQAMKQEIARFLSDEGLLPRDFPVGKHTTSTILAHVKERGASEAIIAAALQLAQGHELRGMEGAGLEPGAEELLENLHGAYTLVVVTNNSYAAAVRALETTGIKDRFDLIIGREQMEAMKPSPAGYLAVLRHYSDIEAQRWISVGDSWMDGKASMGAAIPFISYKIKASELAEKGVTPAAHIDKLLSLLDHV